MDPSAPTLILLPGMDGTSSLFSDLIDPLDSLIPTHVVQYPKTEALTYLQLINLIKPICENSAHYVLLAESFSTPLAIMKAADGDPNLIGVILCAGFVTSPVRQSLGKALLWFAPILFRLALPRLVARYCLIGPKQSSLLLKLRTALASVEPKVLTERIRQVLSCDERSALKQISVPMLYLQASRDRLVSQKSFEEIRHVNPRIALKSIEGPHLLLQCQPKAAAKAVFEFIKELQVPR